jgi:hypothetical protein
MTSRPPRREPAQRSGQHPRMTPMWMLALFWLAGAVVLVAGLYLAFRTPRPPAGSTSRIDQDTLKLSLACAAAVGAVLAGVYAYRKQRLEEAGSRRADEAALNLRFTSASDQLGNASAAVRLAGVYAMASLADDWIEQRQTCVNVLCSYLRMDNLTEPSESQVRKAITSLIRERTQAGNSRAWSNMDFDLTGAHLEDVDFSDCIFAGMIATFSGARFFGGLTSFEGAQLRSDRTIFNGCTFEAETTRFNHCVISSREAWLERITIEGRAWFDYLSTTGKIISFSDSKVTGDRFSLAGSTIASREMIFERVEFTGDRASFSRGRFLGITSFRGCMFMGREVWFDGVQLLGPSADFEGIQYSGVVGLSGIKIDSNCIVSPGPLNFP